MLFIETLRNKPIFKRGNDIIKDLTSSSLEFSRDVQVVDAGTVSDEMAMRPDLIARVFFRDANKLDYILKFNGISNPFSIDSGDVILVPDYDDMKGTMKSKKAKDSRESKDEVTKKFFDPERLSKKDNKRLEYLRAKSESMENGSKTNLPPNFAEPGAQELKIVDGKVIFGDDVVPNAERCVDPLSKARAKSKILQKKIFKNTR
jgi:hypothetical protein